MKLQDRYYELSCTNRKYCDKRPPLDNLDERDDPHDFPRYAVRHTFHQQASLSAKLLVMKEFVEIRVCRIFSSDGSSQNTN